MVILLFYAIVLELSLVVYPENIKSVRIKAKLNDFSDISILFEVDDFLLIEPKGIIRV